MAENQDGTEKTEDPSGKRLSDARQRGQVPRSRELNNFLLMMSGATFIYLLGNSVLEKLAQLFRGGLTIERAVIFDKNLQVATLSNQVFDALIAIAPLFVVLTIVSLLSSIAVSGWNYSADSLQFKWDRISPLKGLKRVFGIQGLVELIKSLIKFCILAVLAGWTIWDKKEELLALGRMPLEVALASAGELSTWLFLILAMSIVVLAAVDVPFQLWNFRRELRMTKQEVRDEHKQTEGSPETRSRIRRAQIEAVKKRMMQAIPNADVVITNPTHYAIALKYDQTKQRAPKVIAKGKDIVAQIIREIAAEHHVPQMRVPSLARALYHTTPIDHEIPTGLYQAVAQVLAYVFSLRKKSSRNY
ncbi:MAG: flagellar biosynthesis protein FlhB, partial [Gammaproteobacteria bacterium]|nr:flagellar biosynthesis protein FlhB [Gammaproteobacteria bacterium]